MEVRLTVPADAASLSVVRTIVASMGARANLTLEDIDDSIIAAEEAALTLIDRNSTVITLEARVDGASLSITFASDGDPDSWPPEGLEESLGWRVLTGVVEGVGRSDRGQTPSVWFERASQAT